MHTRLPSEENLISNLGGVRVWKQLAEGELGSPD